MTTCPNCNTANRDGAKFCRSCGAPIEALPSAEAEATLACPMCSTESKSDAQFCESCGAALEQALASPPEAESVTEPIPTMTDVPEEAPAPPTQPPVRPKPAPTCPACDMEIGSNTQFCGTCGTALQQAPTSPPEAEVDALQEPESAVIAVPYEPPLHSGTALQARYELDVIGLVAQTGFTRIYKVRHRSLGNVLIVKEWLPFDESDVEMFKQAEQEATILAQSDHPQLPRVHNFFVEGRRHFTLMDFVEGQSLEELLEKREEPFDEATVIDWATSICNILEYLHGQHPPVIHRDIKPNSIIITPEGIVKLLGFSIARRHRGYLHRDEILVGTPGFAPLEQYGSGETDARSDIYALGATLHCLLTKRSPGDYPLEIPSLRSLNPNVSPATEEVVAKCLRQNRDERWQTAKQLRQALKALPRPGDVNHSCQLTISTNNKNPRKWRCRL